MSFYLASDVHLRMDHPDRGRRFSSWVSGLVETDSVLIAGDLCDFWMAAGSSESELMNCDGAASPCRFPRPRRIAPHHGRKPRPLALQLLRAGAGSEHRYRAL